MFRLYIKIRNTTMLPRNWYNQDSASLNWLLLENIGSHVSCLIDFSQKNNICSWWKTNAKKCIWPPSMNKCQSMGTFEPSDLDLSRCVNDKAGDSVVSFIDIARRFWESSRAHLVYLYISQGRSIWGGGASSHYFQPLTLHSYIII